MTKAEGKGQKAELKGRKKRKKKKKKKEEGRSEKMARANAFLTSPLFPKILPSALDPPQSEPFISSRG